MFEHPIIILVGVEVAVALLAVFGFLLFHIRGLRRMVDALETKVLSLRDTLRDARGDARAAREQLASAPQKGGPDYGELIDAEISATRNHHLSLQPDRDIVLDISPDTPRERQAVSLRHAFLIAEKEAWLAAEGKEIDWEVLQAKLVQIIEFYEQAKPEVSGELELGSGAAVPPLDDDFAAEPALDDLAGGEQQLRETIEVQQRRIDNLERFRQLFFDADEKWRDASKLAEQYHKQLQQKGRDLGADDEFQALLDRYGAVYGDFGATLGEQPPADGSRIIEIDPEQPTVGRMVIANQEEIQRLRNMAVDQHKMIVKLKQELEAATSIEEKDRVIGELHQQLERHERFLKESDLCTKQLEGELDRVLGENHGLKQKVQELKLGATADGDIEQMAKIIEDFTQQSGQMLTAIETLETECRDLREQLNGGIEPGRADDLNSKLAAAQQELLNLQTQHIELEERYLELKIKAD